VSWSSTFGCVVDDVDRIDLEGSGTSLGQHLRASQAELACHELSIRRVVAF